MRARVADVSLHRCLDTGHGIAQTVARVGAQFGFDRGQPFGYSRPGRDTRAGLLAAPILKEVLDDPPAAVHPPQRQTHPRYRAEHTGDGAGDLEGVH